MQAHDSKSTNIQGVLLTLAVIALAGTAGMVGLLRTVGELGPTVGDIVAFDPSKQFTLDMNTQIAAIPADGTSRKACELDVRTMQTGGGSVVVEARVPQARLAYRVHWAGNRTSTSGLDCGGSADLLLSPEDVSILAIAAGGYGAATKAPIAHSRRSAAGAAR